MVRRVDAGKGVVGAFFVLAGVGIGGFVGVDVGAEVVGIGGWGGSGCDVHVRGDFGMTFGRQTGSNGMRVVGVEDTGQGNSVEESIGEMRMSAESHKPKNSFVHYCSRGHEEGEEVKEGVVVGLSSEWVYPVLEMEFGKNVH